MKFDIRLFSNHSQWRFKLHIRCALEVLDNYKHKNQAITKIYYVVARQSLRPKTDAVYVGLEGHRSNIPFSVSLNVIKKIYKRKNE